MIGSQATDDTSSLHEEVRSSPDRLSACFHVCLSSPRVFHTSLTSHTDHDSSCPLDSYLQELSDEEGSFGSVTPLPSGVKMMETPPPEPAAEEDELPTYTEVVQGASIARNATKDPTPSKEMCRSDVQLQ